MSGPSDTRGPSVEPIMHRAARIEDAFHEFRARRARKRGFLATVVPYTGYGSPTWARILGRVVLARDPRPGSRAERQHRKREESIRGWRSFISVPVSDVEVTVEIEGNTHSVKPDRGGVIDTVIPVQLTPGWHTVKLSTAESTRVFEAPVFIVDPKTNFGIISDVDDTVMVTALPRPLLAAWNTFVVDEHARVPTPGMAVLLERLAATHPGTPVIYLSTGAWNVAPTLTRFLSRNLFPSGPLLLTDWGPTHDRLFRSGREHKRTNLLRLAEEFPGLRWLLVGDDGQHDEVLYGEFTTTHPGSVAAVAIRQLSNGEAVLAGGRSNAEKHTAISGAPWVYAPDGAGLSDQLTALGLLPEHRRGALPCVIGPGIGGIRDTDGMAAAKIADLLRLRLLAQGLEGTPESTPEGVVRRMLAVQAQDFGAACWALGVRAPGSTQAEVIAALDDGRIVRSWPMRGTLHFVPPEDLRWMLSLTAERMVKGLTLRHRQLELESSHLAEAQDVVTDALAGGKSIGRADLMRLWESKGIATTGQRGYHLIYYLAQTGVLCWGPSHKTQQSLVLLDEWAPAARAREPDEAWAEFFVRYLAGHGPATIKDFVWWTKGTVAGAKIAIAVAGDRLTSVEVEGHAFWMTAELADRAAAHPRTTSQRNDVHLLPAFDEYLLGYQNRDPVLDPADADLVVPGGNGVFAPIIVARDRVAGTWKRGRTAKKVVIEPQPFGELSAAQSVRLAHAAQVYGRFLGLPGEVAGPH